MSEIKEEQTPAEMPQGNETRKTSSGRRLPKKCYACATEVMGEYCYNCGQKNDDCRRSLYSLTKETFDNLMSFDSKFFVTLRTLFFDPAKYVREYGSGKRTLYSPPIRFFLVASFIFFTMMTITKTHFLTFEPRFEEVEVPVAVSPDGTILKSETQVRGDFGVSWLRSAKSIQYTEEEAQQTRTLVLAEMERLGHSKEEGEAYLWYFDGMNHIALNSKEYSKAFNEWLSKLFFLMLPLLAAFGLICIRGRRALAYDHLILSLNFHSVVLLSLTVAAIIARVLPGAFVMTIFAIWLLGYYLFTIKGAFRCGWGKSIFTTAVVGTCYVAFLVFALLVISFLSFEAIENIIT